MVKIWTMSRIYKQKLYLSLHRITVPLCATQQSVLLQVGSDIITQSFGLNWTSQRLYTCKISFLFDHKLWLEEARDLIDPSFQWEFNKLQTEKKNAKMLPLPQSVKK